MFERRLVITAELETLSPLHVGTGLHEYDSGLMRDEDRKRLPAGQEGPGLALISLDAVRRPYIPGSTVKGILRGLCPDPEGADEVLLFGTLKREGEGHMGRLTAYGATCLFLPSSVALPKRPNEEPGSFVAARTKIDPGTGTAGHAKLFYQQMVAPGARFRLRLLYLAIGRAEEETRAHRLLMRVLATLARPEGVQFGKGRADGQGLMRVREGTPTIVEKTIGQDGCLVDKPLPLKDLLREAAAIPARQKNYTLMLRSDGPFFVSDWSWRPPRGQDTNEPQLKAQRRNGATPELPGTSIMGALRARAAWLAALAAHREQPIPVAAEGNDPRCPVKRLFGAEAWGALLRLERIDSTRVPTPRKPLTSVKLDRFSGAPIDNALYTVDAFVAPCFEIVLALDNSRAAAEDRTFVQQLIADLKRNGLMAGHGANRGFGWFKVTETGHDNR